MGFILIAFLGEGCWVNFRQKSSSALHLVGVLVNFRVWSRHDGEDPLYPAGNRTPSCVGCSRSLYWRTFCQFRLLLLLTSF